MPGLGWHTRLLGGCARCLVPGSSTVRATRVVLRPSARYASTATKPRAKKTPASSGEEVVSFPKKSLSTKSPAVSSTKTPRKKKADSLLETPTEAAALVPKKSTRASSTKSNAAAAKKKAETVQSTVGATPTPRTRGNEGSVRTAPIKEQATHNPGQLAGANVPPNIRKPADVNSPEYKAASRKWTSLMVGLPLLIVSSYFLYDRLILGNMPQTLGASASPLSPPEAKQPEA